MKAWYNKKALTIKIFSSRIVYVLANLDRKVAREWWNGFGMKLIRHKETTKIN